MAVGQRLLIAPARAGQPEPEMGPTGLANARPNGPVVAPAYTRMGTDSVKPVMATTQAPDARVTKTDTAALARAVDRAIEAAQAPVQVASTAPATRAERQMARATVEVASHPASQAIPAVVTTQPEKAETRAHKADTKADIPADKAPPARTVAATKGPTAKNQRQVRTHTVQAGDTLWNISQRYDGITVQDLIRLNKLKDKNLRPGQKLIVG